MPGRSYSNGMVNFQSTPTSGKTIAAPVVGAPLTKGFTMSNVIEQSTLAAERPAPATVGPVAATTTTTFEVRTVRTSKTGKVSVLGLSRTLVQGTRTERGQADVQLHSQQLANGQFKPFARTICEVFGAKARSALSEVIIRDDGLTKHGLAQFARTVRANCQARTAHKGVKAHYWAILRAVAQGD